MRVGLFPSLECIGPLSSPQKEKKNSGKTIRSVNFVNSFESAGQVIKR